MTLLEEMLKLVNGIDEPPVIDEDWCIYDYCGGNFDDAYQIGIIDGESFLADQIRGILRKHKES